MADTEATMSQTSNNSSVNPPLAKMIHLDELEQTVLGLVKKTFKEATKAYPQQTRIVSQL